MQFEVIWTRLLHIYEDYKTNKRISDLYDFAKMMLNLSDNFAKISN